VLFEVICIESIFALYLSSVGLVELLLLALHPSEPDVLRSISTFWAHHSFAGERITKLSTGYFHFVTITTIVYCAFQHLSYQLLIVFSFVILASTLHKPHSTTIVFCCPHLKGFGLQFSLIDLVQSLWT
jgi:hypothetical protein